MHFVQILLSTFDPGALVFLLGRRNTSLTPLKAKKQCAGTVSFDVFNPSLADCAVVLECRPAVEFEFLFQFRATQERGYRTPVLIVFFVNWVDWAWFSFYT